MMVYYLSEIISYLSGSTGCLDIVTQSEIKLLFLGVSLINIHHCHDVSSVATRHSVTHIPGHQVSPKDTDHDRFLFTQIDGALTNSDEESGGDMDRESVHGQDDFIQSRQWDSGDQVDKAGENVQVPAVGGQDTAGPRDGQGRPPGEGDDDVPDENGQQIIGDLIMVSLFSLSTVL